MLESGQTILSGTLSSNILLEGNCVAILVGYDPKVVLEFGIQTSHFLDMVYESEEPVLLSRLITFNV